MGTFAIDRGAFFSASAGAWAAMVVLHTKYRERKVTRLEKCTVIS